MIQRLSDLKEQIEMLIHEHGDCLVGFREPDGRKRIIGAFCHERATSGVASDAKVAIELRPEDWDR